MNSQRPQFDGARMRKLRKEKGLSADRLSKLADLTARHIWRLEGGNRPNAAAITLARVALALDTTVEYLLGLTDDPGLYRAGQSERLTRN